MVKITDVFQTILEKLQKELYMEDWNITIIYEPDDNSEDCAELFSINALYKKAIIKVFRNKEHTWEEIILHELYHCKTGAMIECYDDMIDSLTVLLKETAQKFEEQLVEDLTKDYYRIKKGRKNEKTI